MGKVKKFFKFILSPFKKAFNKVKDKLKSFFSPVKGGHQDGLKFGKWFMHGQRLGLWTIFIGSTTAFISFADKSTFDPELTFNGVAIFLGSISLLIIFKTLQHWNDLKNHTSR